MTDGLSFEIEKEILRLEQLLDQWLKVALSSGYTEEAEEKSLEMDIATTVLEMKETLRKIKLEETLMVQRRIHSEAMMERAAEEKAEKEALEAEAEAIARAEAEAAEREEEYLKERERGYWG